MLDITLLGTGGMLPLKNRWLTSCIISCEGKSILIDCGEGTQIALKNTKCRMKPIDLICITHFHADHLSGLPGFLLSMGNEGRTDPVMIAGPKGLEDIVRSLCVIAPNLPFEISFMELCELKEFQLAKLNITPFRAEHSIECLGYTFLLPRSGKFDPVLARKNNVPVSLWSRLQKGETVTEGGRSYTPDMVMGKSRKGLKVTYCTDSRPTKNIADHAKGSDLFICEGLYYDPGKLARAKKTGHMLYSEAAELAGSAQVKRLWLTHYSPAVEFPEEGLSAAKEIFPDAECGFDGKNIVLSFEN